MREKLCQNPKLQKIYIIEMSQPGYIAIEMIIDKFSEFIEWILGKRKKSELEQLNDLNASLKKRFNISIYNVSEESFDIIKGNLNEFDLQILENIISLLFKISISSKSNEEFQKLKSGDKLNERIMELILFTETKYAKLPIELYNIKNSLQHKLRNLAN
jgi:hypothetical protein